MISLLYEELERLYIIRRIRVKSGDLLCPHSFVRHSRIGNKLGSFSKVNRLTLIYLYDKLIAARGRGVVVNMRPCQGRDRGFNPRRPRRNLEIFSRFFVLMGYARTLLLNSCSIFASLGILR